MSILEDDPVNWSLRSVPIDWLDAPPTAIPTPLLARKDRPDLYQPDDDLLDAAEVAIRLGQPLLLTGRPGAGKTAFAGHLAWRLGLAKALRFQVRTDMEARELFYRYDNLGRFRAANEHSGEAPVEFLTLNALGEAVVLAAESSDLRSNLLAATDPPPRVRSVVLIDEIDKAPRDVPNDLLGYVTGERIWFDIPELGGRGAERFRIEASSDLQPIIVCTSNDDKTLPDAFLRRCIFHEIKFPKGDRLRDILTRQVSGLSPSDPLVLDVQTLTEKILESGQQLRKEPGLAEVIGFLLSLQARGYTGGDRLFSGGRDDWKAIARSTLFKTKDDQAQADGLLKIDDDSPA